MFSGLVSQPLRVPANGSDAALMHAICLMRPLCHTVDDGYTTAESYVMLQLDGERSIIMASGATSLIDNKVMWLATPFRGNVGGRVSCMWLCQPPVPCSGLTLTCAAADTHHLRNA